MELGPLPDDVRSCTDVFLEVAVDGFVINVVFLNDRVVPFQGACGLGLDNDFDQVLPVKLDKSRRFELGDLVFILKVKFSDFADHFGQGNFSFDLPAVLIGNNVDWVWLHIGSGNTVIFQTPVSTFCASNSSCLTC